MEYDFLKIEEASTVIKTEASLIVSHKKSHIQRNGFRRFEKNKVVQTSRLGEANLEQLIVETKKYGGLGTEHDYGFAQENKEHKTSPFLDSSALESYKEALDYLKTKYPNFVFSGECTILNKTVSLTSSYGLDLSSSGGTLEWYFLYQKKGSGNMLDGYIFGTGIKDNILKSLKEQEIYIERSQKVSQLKAGSYPVLLVDEKLVLKKLLESFQVNKYKESAVLYNDKLGQKLFSSKVDLVDSGYDPVNGNFMFFDGEGSVRADDLLLLKEGVFNSLISDLRYGKKYGVPTTGNGTRLYNRGVNLNFKGLRFKKRNRSWSEIIKELPVCIVALVTAGGDSNDLGEYSTPIQIGYVFRNGELEGLLPQMTVKTSINDFLGDKLIDISADGFTEDSPSACVISEMDVLAN
jgi:predicted Zn-dependent protease